MKTISDVVDKKSSLTKEQPKEWFQIVAILSSCLASISSGILFSWSSPSIPKIIADKVNYDITLEEASYFTVLPPIGAIISCFLFSHLNDVIGRKRTLLLIAIPHMSCMLMTATASSKWVLYAARLFLGFGDACLFASLPIYVGEVATPKVRGTWGNVMTLFIYVGQLSINTYGNYLSVSRAAFISLAVPTLFLLTFSFMPETPYFYLMKGRVEDARHSLQRLRRVADVQEELSTLKADVERQMSERGTWRELFTVKANRKALAAGVFLRTSQQTAGTGVFAVYIQFIFLKSGSNLSASTSTIIFFSIITLLNLCAGFTLDKFGRKRSFFYSLLFAGIVLSIETIYFYIEQFHVDIDIGGYNWVPLAGMLAWVVVYSFGLGIVPTLMLGELFSASIKGKGLCVLNIVFGILVSSLTKVFQLLTEHVGIFSPFMFFSICCFVSTVLSLYFVPDTQGKTLEEIQQSLNGTKKPKNNEC